MTEAGSKQWYRQKPQEHADDLVSRIEQNAHAEMICCI